MKQLWVVFLSVFLAEVGDKTQLATMLFAANAQTGKWGVFLAASAALVSATLLAVLAGSLVSRMVPESTLKLVAGAGFIVVGVWTLISAYR